MSSSKGIRSWLNSRSVKKKSLTREEQEERDLQRAIELSQRTQKEENEQRARLELLAERTLDMSRLALHRHNESMPFVNGEEDNSFQTVTNRVVVKKEKGMTSPPRQPQPKKRRRQQQKHYVEQVQLVLEKEQPLDHHVSFGNHDIKKVKEEKEEENDDIVFEMEDIDRWLAEEEENVYDKDGYHSHTEDLLASSPPSPFLHQFNDHNNEKNRLPQRNSVQYEREEQYQEEPVIEIENNDQDDVNFALCPLCRKQVPRSILYPHTLGCHGDPIPEQQNNHNINYDDNEDFHDNDDYNSLDESHSTMESSSQRQRIDTNFHESIKRKSAKSMAAGVLQQQKRQKSLNMSPSRRIYNHYSLHDAELEEQFDSVGFGDNVSGLSWEARGQSRYR
ncbi:hypothetical protein BDA99DRAFT_512784 [Phascolomyces articulosus]|uniref:Uncharacterized protein n=1 Tax=Phascolomyces articulosus TaxID=60185 RepID=A0AAD5K8K7_9FUNG|nr:hypothetical protein BDA99DRAFT_512784 [Phascolomyces articulosus]